MKKIKIILGIKIFLFSMTFAYAATNDSQIIKHRFENIYAVYDGLDRVHLFYAQKYTLNGITAYCIEPGVGIDTEIYSSTTDWNITSLSEDVIEYIRLVAYYGYDYEGHNTANYYLASQELIWEKITNRETYWVSTLDQNGPKIDINKEKIEIENLIKNHNKLPSINNYTTKRNVGQSNTLQDYNNVLSNYEITNINVDNFNPRINNNELYLPSYNKAATIEITFKRKNYQNKANFIYYQGSNQKLISAGYLDNITFKVYINNQGGSLTINKLDKETNINKPQGLSSSLENAKYGIYDSNNNLINTLTTNKKGTASTTNNLSIGSYYVKEITPSIGYELDETKYNFEIKPSNLNVTLNVYEQIIRRDIEIYKYLKEDNKEELIPDKGITFSIYDSNNELVTTITTNEEGLAKTNLIYGKYLAKQNNNKEGTIKVNDFEIIVNNNSPSIIKYVFSSKLLTAKLKINNKDSESLLNISSNSTFKIKNIDNDELICQNITYPNVETICEYTTNNGVFITPNTLKVGNYEIIQTNTPNGYKDNKESLVIRLDLSSEIIQDNEYGNYIEYDFINEKVRSNISITVKGEEPVMSDNKITYKKKDLPNVEVSLYAEEDIITKDNIVHYQKGDLIDKQISNEFGQVSFNDLYLGNYKIIQTNIDNNYKENNEEYLIVLEKNKKFTIYNTLKKGDLKITKIDSITKDKLSNIRLNILNSDDELIYNNITSKTGLMKLNNLPLGKYYIKEIETIEGYLLNEEIVNFEVKENDELINLELESTPIIGSLELTVLDVLTNKGIPNTNILLFDDNDKLIYEGRTNELGMLIVNDLRYGNYYITEKDNSKQERLLFEIKKNNEVVKLTMIKENIITEVPNTGLVDNYKIELISSILILFGLGEIYVIKKKILN